MKRLFAVSVLLFLLVSVACLQPIMAVDFIHPNSPYPLPLYPPTGESLPNTSDFPVNIIANRTSGVGPLYVFFSATSTLTAADGYADMEATYIWSFDTTGVDSYTKYNRVSGFVAGHVFNLAGTYTVRLDVFDKLGRHGYGITTITVTDAPAGGWTNTYYVALTGDDANNDGKSTAAPFKTPAKASTKAAPNTRILLRNGDVFNVTTLSISGNGPGILSGYSDPGHPSSVAPELHSDQTGWSSILYFGENADDWRIVGLKMTSNGHTTGANGNPIYPGGTYLHGTRLLVSRCEFYNLGHNVIDISNVGNCTYECEMHLLSNYGIWSTRDEVTSHLDQYNSIIGNYVHDWEGDLLEHALRLQGGNNFFIGFNVMEATPGFTMSNTQIRGNSWYVVLYGNVLDSATGVQPQNEQQNEFVHHCAVDSNIFIGRADSTRGQALSIRATDIMVRNNIIYNYISVAGLKAYTSTASSPMFIPCTRVYLENNTSINPTVGAHFLQIVNDSLVLATRLFNNVHYGFASSSNQYDSFIRNPFTGVTIFNGSSDNNLIYGNTWSPTTTPLFGYYPDVTFAAWTALGLNDTHSLFADPKISVTSPVVANFARPVAGSPCLNAGVAITTTGNWADATGRIRDANPDIGAFEFIPSGKTPSAPRGLRIR
jgi:hypothetical protein